MKYIIHFGLVLVLFAEVYALELIGPMRENEGVYAWAILVLIPGLCLVTLLQRPGFQRHADVCSLAFFAVAGIGIGWFSVHDANAVRDMRHHNLLITPFQVQQELVSRLPLSAPGAELTDNDRMEDEVFAMNYSLPQGLDVDTEDALHLSIAISHSMMRKIIASADLYKKAREAYRTTLQKELDEKADAYIRTLRGRMIGIGMIIVGAGSSILAVVLYLLRRSAGR